MTTQTPSRRRPSRAWLSEALETAAVIVAALPAFAALALSLVGVFS